MIADVKIHALTTGTVQVKHCFLFPKRGLRRQLSLFMPDEWSDPLPIHVWAIEHDGRLIVVDTGEVASVNNVPFARFGLTREQELPAVFTAAGLNLGAVDTVVLTHMHGDHMDGAVHAPGPVLVHGEELDFSRSIGARFFQKVLRQPVPAGVDFQRLTLDDGPFGAFERSKTSGRDRPEACGQHRDHRQDPGPRPRAPDRLPALPRLGVGGAPARA